MEFDLGQAIVLFVTSLGLISCLKTLTKLLSWTRITFLRPKKSLTRSYGAWAVITGPTDGIGKALAIEMAVSEGLNLVLVARNPEKLSALTEEIRGLRRDVRLKTVAIDLARSDGEEVRRAVEEAIEGLDVGVLVNNAGLAYPYASYFHEVGPEVVMDILRVNVEAATWIVKAVVPGMLKRKRGAIINIGSASTAIFPSYPLYSVYAASKAYVFFIFFPSIFYLFKFMKIDIRQNNHSKLNQFIRKIIIF